MHTQFGIQVGKRFIEQQNAGMHYQGTYQRHTLLLPSRHLRGNTVGKVIHLHQLQGFMHSIFNLSLGTLLQLQSVSDIVRYIQVRKQGIVLENHTDIAFIGSQGRDIILTYENPAVRRGFESRNHSQDSSLAAA